MTGDELVTSINKFMLYKMKITTTVHLEEDPVLNCQEYDLTKNYNDCIESEIEESFKKLLGCVPHWFSSNNNNTCQRNLNLTYEESKSVYNLLNDIITNYDSKACKLPCTIRSYHSKFSSYNPINNNVISSGISIIFDESVAISQTNWVINAKTLLLRLGSVVGVCRTLLWILLIIVGAFRSMKRIRFLCI